MKSLVSILLILFTVPVFAVPTTLSIVSTTETAALFADTAADTANGNQMRNNNCDLVLLLRNSHATNSSTVTVAAAASSFTIPGYGVLTKSNASVSLAAGEHKHIGPLPCVLWNDSNGFVQVTYSGTGTVLVTPIRVPR